MASQLISIVFIPRCSMCLSLLVPCICLYFLSYVLCALFLYLYELIHICQYSSGSTCIHRFVIMYVSDRVSPYLSVCISPYPTVSVRICPSVSVRIRPCQSVSVHPYLSVMSVSIRICPCPSVSVRVRLSVRIRPCVSGSVCPSASSRICFFLSPSVALCV